jgi:hypothetical protein
MVENNVNTSSEHQFHSHAQAAEWLLAQPFLQKKDQADTPDESAHKTHAQVHGAGMSLPTLRALRDNLRKAGVETTLPHQLLPIDSQETLPGKQTEEPALRFPQDTLLVLIGAGRVTQMATSEWQKVLQEQQIPHLDVWISTRANTATHTKEFVVSIKGQEVTFSNLDKRFLIHDPQNPEIIRPPTDAELGYMLLSLPEFAQHFQDKKLVQVVIAPQQSFQDPRFSVTPTFTPPSELGESISVGYHPGTHTFYQFGK